MSAPKASPSKPPPASSRRERPPPEPDAEGRVPVVEMHRGIEVVFYPGPLPRTGEGPLTKAELDFRWLIAGELVGDRMESRDDFRAWCASARHRWRQRR